MIGLDSVVEHKSFNLAEFKVDAASGEFSGYGSVFGNEDAGGDIVMPGAFAKAIPAFLKDGFISWSHDWSMPIAMPTEAREDRRGLFLAGRFHSTPDAQTARTIAGERVEAGLRTGLSIGYGVEDFALDAKGRRQLKVVNPLFEVGFVMVPMNREANLAAVKNGRPGSDAPYAEHAAWVRAVVKAFIERTDDRAEWRAAEGRQLSAANREELAELLGDLRSLGSVADAVDQVLASTDPGKTARAIAALAEEARYLGVPL